MNLDDQDVTLSLTVAPQPITSKSMVRVDVLLSPCMADFQRIPSNPHQPTPEQRVPKTLGPFKTGDNDNDLWIDPVKLILNYDSILNHGHSLDGMMQLRVYKSASFACSDSVNPMGKSCESFHPHITTWPVHVQPGLQGQKVDQSISKNFPAEIWPKQCC